MKETGGPRAGTIAPVLVADHPALDMLNTVIRVDDGLVDVWQSDEDVRGWLEATGLLDKDTPSTYRRGGLLAAARGLREAVRPMVLAHKAKRRVDPAPLNAFLAKARSHIELTPAKGGALKTERRYERSAPEGLLAPLAEAAAELLATGDFSLVRACEGPQCVLWFYDRTKAHRRRWCSMEVCGNRHKVAQFRARQ